jgi:hypothetical protein
MASFRINSSNNFYLLVGAAGRAHPDSNDYWDGNWLDSNIEINAGAFRGAYGACLRGDEFQAFRDKLVPLYTALSGEAEFSSMENWLAIKIKGDGLGHFEAECKARDTFGSDSRLEFTLSFDQTQLPEIIKGIDSILEKFPVRGRSDV